MRSEYSRTNEKAHYSANQGTFPWGGSPGELPLGCGLCTLKVGWCSHQASPLGTLGAAMSSPSVSGLEVTPPPRLTLVYFSVESFNLLPIHRPRGCFHDFVKSSLQRMRSTILMSKAIEYHPFLLLCVLGVAPICVGLPIHQEQNSLSSILSS